MNRWQHTDRYAYGSPSGVGDNPKNTGESSAVASTVATSRATPFFARRERAYASWASGEGRCDAGARFRFASRAALADLLSALPPPLRVVYLVGELPRSQRPQSTALIGGALNAFLSWCLADPGEDWIEATDGEQRGHYLDREQPQSTVLRLRHRASGRRLELRSFATWGTDGVDPETARAALALLEARLRAEWHGYEVPLASAVVLATAAMTGERLWQACIPAGKAWPILPSDVRDLLHHTSGQGRIEHFQAPPGVETAAGLFVLDGRLMYAMSCGGLGGGPIEQDTVDAYAPFRDGWYRVVATVPRDWRHVGLLPLQGARSRDGWEYPREPGRTFETWIGDRELLAARWPFPSSCRACAEGRGAGTAAHCPLHGWRVRIRERLLLDRTRGRPLDLWRDRLVRVYEALDAAHRREPQDQVVDVARKAARAILLGTIGGFHRSQRPLVRRTPLGRMGEIPPGAHVEPVTASDGGMVLLWHESESTHRRPGDAPRMVHHDLLAGTGPHAHQSTRRAVQRHADPPARRHCRRTLRRADADRGPRLA